MDNVDVEIYQDLSGKQPYLSWEQRLSRDVRAIITTRLARLRIGNFGCCKNLSGGIYELKIDYGPGYRVYFGKRGKTVVVLFCGGDKSSQRKDITKAREYWADYQKRGKR